MPQSLNEAPSERPIPGMRHSAIRIVIAGLVDSPEGELGPLADAIALAAHPWPDMAVSAETLRTIGAELLPLRGMPHHDPSEQAIDRLLRLAEALHHENLGELAESFSAAAESAQDHPSASTWRTVSPLRDDREHLVVDPLGLRGRMLREQVGGAEELLAGGVGGKEVEATLDALLVSAAMRGSGDVARILGSSEPGITLGRLFSALAIETPWDSFDVFVDLLDTRRRDILVSRLFAFEDPDTLEALGDRWGVSRERIRQLESRLIGSVEERLSPDLKRLARALVAGAGGLLPSERLWTAARALSAGSRWPECMAAAVLRYGGPWREFGSWTASVQAAEHTIEVDSTIRGAADAYGVLTGQAADLALEALPLRRADRDDFLRSALGFSKVGDTWVIRDTQSSRAAAALTHLGRAATKHEIADLANLDLSRLGGLLGQMAGVVRADKERWGFVEWIDDPYEGIVVEIEQRIDDHGGSVSVEVLLEELPRRFGVAEVSVATMLSTDAFVVEHGMARRNHSEFEGRDPSSNSEAVLVGAVWGERILLAERHLLGYSVKVARDIAFANGIRPEDDLVVPVTGFHREASIIWRRHDPTGRVDVGRLSEVFRALGCRPDNEVIVLPAPGGVEIVRPENLPTAPEIHPPAASDAGVDLDFLDPLTELLEGH